MISRFLFFDILVSTLLTIIIYLINFFILGYYFYDYICTILHGYSTDYLWCPLFSLWDHFWYNKWGNYSRTKTVYTYTYIVDINDQKKYYINFYVYIENFYNSYLNQFFNV